MYKLFGRFDPVTGARIETALTAAANRLWHGEDAKAGPATIAPHGDGWHDRTLDLR